MSTLLKQGDPRVRIATVPGTNGLWQLEKHRGGSGTKADKKASPPKQHYDPWQPVRRPTTKEMAMSQMMGMEIGNDYTLSSSSRPC
jgi:hypothetical protein